MLCIKSELHLNQDGVQTPPSAARTASLPVRDLFDQIIAETGAELVITTGTAGAVFAEHDLGDVVVTRAAQFRVARSSGTSRSPGRSTFSRLAGADRAARRRPSS